MYVTRPFCFLNNLVNRPKNSPTVMILGVAWQLPTHPQRATVRGLNMANLGSNGKRSSHRRPGLLGKFVTGPVLHLVILPKRNNGILDNFFGILPEARKRSASVALVIQSSSNVERSSARRETDAVTVTTSDRAVTMVLFQKALQVLFPECCTRTC